MKQAHARAKPHMMTLGALAEHLGGRLEGGNPDLSISGIAPITEALEGMVTFLTDAKKVAEHREELSASKAVAVIAAEAAGPLPLPVIRVPHAYAGLVKALQLFDPSRQPLPGLHPTSFVHEDAQVHPTASVGPLAVIEAGAVVGAKTRIDAQVNLGPNVRVGERCHLHARVVVRERCIIGDRCILQAGCVVGSDGFGYARTPEGQIKIPHIGIVQVDDDVELGANVTIDRGTMGVTHIGAGTKIDNLVHVAHNCVIGRQCTIVAQVGLSGSTILEDQVTLAGQVGTVGHVRVGAGTTVAARGVVTQDVEPQSFVSGFPLKPHQEERRIMVALRRLPELVRLMNKLKKQHPELSEEEKS
ncbi:MAG TPA: UDP-3-O-(3-hydroxymyristoyl)glucosamine N-acyltransferase [Candidatus Ozemobacteraceae bacterium]|nr:UDP-3-O-(3-hydroxymyristoyl)glucosamine N-acyltransferase [Candidatus Ozemobacteraceae bacterium]